MPQDGAHSWTFDIVGTTAVPSDPGHAPFAVVNYTYYDAMRASNRGTVLNFVVIIDDPRHAASIARSIDRLFVNSPAPTLTQQESEQAAQAVAELGDVGRLTDSVIIAVFFSLLFLTGNVLLQSVRERTPELAVLKTLGYSDLRILLLVELEALVLCLSGAVIGLVLAGIAFHFLGRAIVDISDYLRPTNVLSVSVLLSGLGLAVALTLVAAAIPAWGAKRLNIVEAMRVRA